MIIINYIYCILLALFWVINESSQIKSITFKFVLICIIIFSSFYSIFINSKLNLITGFFFYLNQSNITDVIVLKEIIFFSKKAFENIILITILIYILKKIKKIKKLFFKVKVKKYILFFILILLNPFSLEFLYKKFTNHNSNKIDKLVLKQYINKTHETNNYSKNRQEKNIIFFIIESLNKEFVNNKKLMPFLNNLSKKSINFENVNELDITNYTTSGMYAIFCGNTIPEYKIFEELNCLTHVLAENDYDISFIRGDSNDPLKNLVSYSNINNKINYGQKSIEICDFDCLKKTSSLDDIHAWGVHDEVVFDKTLETIKKKISNNKKFFVFSKTVDSHIEGYPSINCNKNEYFKSKIGTTFSCVDDLIEKFFKKLEKISNLKDTTIIIASDHLLMNEAFSDKFGNNHKNLFIIHDFNSQKFLNYKKKSTKFDIPSTILDFLGINNKLGVGSSLFSKNQNLIENFDNLNSILNSTKSDIEFRQEINFIERIKNLTKITLKKIFSENIYNNIKKIYHGLNQSISIIKYKYSSKSIFKKDINMNNYKIIAHAGGAIDGIPYTNSLEAINNSHNKGFKYIELDFLKTIDGHYVAVHDWKKWKQLSGYKGKLPPSLEIFKKFKILNKYNTISIYDLNKWISERPDVILVTDKVEDPRNFLDYFKFKNQLIMELFDYESIVKAKELNLKYFVSDIFLYKNLPINRNLLEKLSALGVKNIAASNIVINKDINFFIEAKEDMKMNIYFYQISEDLKNIEKDQINFLCSYPDLLSGGYFETADFENDIKC